MVMKSLRIILLYALIAILPVRSNFYEEFSQFIESIPTSEKVIMGFVGCFGFAIEGYRIAKKIFQKKPQINVYRANSIKDNSNIVELAKKTEDALLEIAFHLEQSSKGMLEPIYGVILQDNSYDEKFSESFAFSIAQKLGYSLISITRDESTYTTDDLTELFAKARSFAPSVIFINKIELCNYDILAEFYKMQKNNEPILVIGTTNNINLFPPGLLQPGRFERAINLD